MVEEFGLVSQTLESVVVDEWYHGLVNAELLPHPVTDAGAHTYRLGVLHHFLKIFAADCSVIINLIKNVKRSTNRARTSKKRNIT